MITRNISRRKLRLSGFVEPLEQRIAPATFTVTSAADSGVGTLRQAISLANTTANSGGPDIISFNLGTGPFLIEPLSQLPDITEAVIIDGYSQSGATVNNLASGTNANIIVELSGKGISSSAVNGLVLAGGGGSIVRGLAIYGFGPGINETGNGILIKSSNNRVEGNFIGTDKSGVGNIANENKNAGVRVGDFLGSTPIYSGNIIGGLAAADRNILTGNAFGVQLDDQSSGTVILGNLIGLNKDGATAYGNFQSGVADSGSVNTQIGDGSAAGRNVISGNQNAGILQGHGVGIQIRGNYIGTNAAGTAALGNLGAGIAINYDGSGGLIEGNVISGNGTDGVQLGSPVFDGGATGFNVRNNFIGTNSSGTPLGNAGKGVGFYTFASNNVIGGTIGGQGNTIAFNSGAGIEDFGGGSNNRFYSNSIRSNGGLGIDNADTATHFFGVTLNDALDADSVTNWPEIQTYTNTGSSVTLDGALNAKANTTYRVEFFVMSPSEVDASGYGEGALYLGFRDITTNGTGAGVFNFTNTISVPPNSAFSATATPTSGGSTSEFGPAKGPAVSYSWNGAVDSDWFKPANWTPNGVPGPLDNATLSNGTLALSKSVSVVSFTQSGGTIFGPGDLTARGVLTWSGGSHASGDLRVSTGGTGAIGSGTTALTWTNGGLENYGALTVQNLGVNFTQGTIVNSAKDAVLTLNAGFNDPDGSATSVSAVNAGLILKQGAGTFGFDGGILLSNQGTVRPIAGTFKVGGINQSGDASIELSGGGISSTDPISLNGGQLAGSGTISGDLSSVGGSVYVGGKDAPGTLNITGNFTLGSGGRLVVDLGGSTPGTDYDRLNVTGAAVLGGVLEKTFLPTFTLQGSTSFTFIDAGSVGNSFLGQSGGPNLTIQYTATQVKLNAQGYTVTTTADSGAGSLRQAIIDANAAAGLDLILFNIAGGGVKTIAPVTALPVITGSVYLDGYSQPGSVRNTSLGNDYNGAPLIEIQGVNIPAASSVGLSLGGAGGHTVSGVILNEFQQSAIAITSGSNVIVGNWVGLRANGVGGSLTGDGVSIQSGSLNMVGGMLAGDRNIISGNNIGLHIANASTFTVVNNWFGLYAGNVGFSNPFTANVSGGIVIENTTEGTIGGQGASNVVAATLSGSGIRITNSNGIHILENRIGYNGNDLNPLLGQINGHGILVEGGSFAIDIGGGSDRNRIVGATGDGIRVVDSPGVTIQRNIIGATDTGGAGTYGNTGHGIHIIGDASTNITIGGANFDDGNYITRNGGHGIYVENTTIQSDALIRKNSIWRNAQKGIKLTSPQGAIAAPVITNVSTSPDVSSGGFTVDIAGTFSGAPSTNYTIDLSSSYNNDGEGRIYIKTVNVTTTGTGNATFNFSFNANQASLGALPGAIGGNFTATASNLTTGSTSEFSSPVSPAPMTLVVTNTADSGPGSLRDAITIANQHPGRDQINFNIAGTGVQTIFITSNLPNIEDPVFINGYSQSGSSPNSNAVGVLATNAVINIAIRGAAPVDRGFFVLAGDSEFRGLNIAGMYNTGQFLTGQAFQIANEGDTIIAGNFLGTDAAGNAFVPNSAGGIFSNWSTGNRIGGAQPGDRNIIASETNGVDFFSQSNGGVIRGNIFGLGANGTTPLGNTHSAILLNGSSKTTVSENIITNNGTGIRIGTNGTTFFDQTRGNVISQNRIYNNSGFASGLGIDLIDFSGDGVSLNDPNDADSGPNGMLNFPVLTGVTGSSISGTYSGLANTTFTIELFASVTGDVSGYGEGAAYIGTTTVTTNGSGTGSFTYNGAIPGGQKYTATATSAELGTSEFSQFIAASATYTWDAGGGADTSWFNPLNWTSDTVPSAGDTAQLLSNFTVTLTGPVTIAKFIQNDGTVTGGGAMTITSEFDWTKGTQTGPSTLTIASGAVAMLTGANAKTLDRRFLDNQGTVVISGTGALEYRTGPLITNSGVFEFQSDADLVALDAIGATFVNTGVWKKTSGTATSTVGGSNLSFTNSGDVEVLSGILSFGGSYTQSAGQTTLNGGALGGGITFVFSGGQLEGVGPITGSVNNTGAMVVPGGTGIVGAMSISGNYTQTSGGTLVVELSNSESDILAVTGTAALGGTVVLGLLAGYTPVIGDSFAFVTAATRTGIFSSLVGSGVISLGYGGTTAFAVRTPQTFTWTGSASADWFDAANWNRGEVPTDGDSVVLNTNSTMNITDNAVTIAGFEQSAGTFLGTAGLTVTNTFSLTGGTHGGSGQTIIASTATLSGGTVARPFENSGETILSGTTSFNSFTQNGVSAVLEFSSGSTSGVFTINGGAVVGVGTHSAGGFTNVGATVRPGGSGQIGTLHLNGYEQQSGGTLEIEIEGTGAGQFDVLDLTGAATLDGGLSVDTVSPFVPAAGNTFRVVTSAAGPSGNFATFTGDVARLSKTVDGSGVLLAANTLTYVWDNDAGDGDWFNPLNWDLNSGLPGAADTAVLNIASSIVLNTAATVSVFSQNAGSLTGAGGLTVTDGFTWSGGTVATSVSTGTGSANTIGGGSATTLNSALLVLAGNTVVVGTEDITLAGSGSEIRNTGSLTFSGSAGVGGTGLFKNASGSAGITVSGGDDVTIGVDFAGNAALSITSGSMAFGADSNWSGAAPQVASGAEIRFSGGTHDFVGLSGFTGSGVIRQISGTMNFDGSGFTVGGGQLFVQDGDIGGTASLIVDGSFSWLAGAQTGTSTTRVSFGGTLTAEGSGLKTLNQRTLRVDAGGVFRVTGDGDVAFIDDALLEVAGELNVSSAGSFTNAGGALSLVSILSSGSFIKVGSGVNMLDVPFINAGAVSLMEGAVNFTAIFEQTAGYTSLSGGGIGFANPAEFSGGVLKGSGAIGGTINNTGAIVSPGASPGQFVINGDYIQGPAGSLLIEIQGALPGTGYDQVRVTGNASLDGGLEVTVGGIIPVPGQTFSAIAAGSVSGTFSSSTIPDTLESRATATGFDLFVPVLPLGLVDLSSFTGRNGAFIPGLASGDNTGVSVTGLGSINGDSFGDFAIGASRASGGGATYIVFGKFGSFGRDFDLASLDGTEGFKIVGGADGRRSGFSVSSPGDVNGDGIRDILIGDPNYSGSFTNSGAAFVVYGKSTAYPAVIDLSLLDGTDGFRMDFEIASSFAGTTVSGAGDVNGDGVNDLMVGVPDSDVVAANAGAAFVVFGRPTTATPFPASIVLSSLNGADGFAITGSFAGDRFGSSLAGAGDINDDGFDDLVFGAPNFDGAAGTDSGAAYVVFGKAGGFTATLAAGTLNGKNGFRMEGRAGAERLGIGVSTAGDMNGDGTGDFVVSGRAAKDPESGADVGVAYVVFGKKKAYTATQDLSKLNGANGFRLFTEAKSVAANVSLSSVGDFNVDGFDDIAIGSPGSSSDAGVTYLMFGRRGGFAADLSLSTLNATTGFRFRGEVSFDESGTSVSGTDVNGDGRADLIIGAPHPGNKNSSPTPGGAYVIYGLPTQEIPDVGTGGTSITFDDVDGDQITIKSTNGKVTADMLIFGPGGILQMVDLTATNTLKDGANITFSVKQAGGNGLLNVGAIHADGLRLGKIIVTGDLGQIDVGNDDPTKPALKQLIVGSIGEMGGSTQQTGTEDPLVSEIRGALPKVIVKGNFTNATFNVLGKLGNITINGNFTGTGAFSASQFAGLAALGHDQISSVAGGTTLASSGLSAGSIGNLNIKGAVQNAAVKSNGGINSASVGSVNKGAIVAAGPMKIVKVLGELVGDDTTPSVISALPKGKSVSAIDKLTIKGNVSFAEILIGYDANFAGVNGDAGIGSVVVNGNWTASSLVAGIKDDTADGFGQNDIVIPGFEGTTKIFSKIANLIIKGTVAGTPNDDDSFAITAQKIGKATISGQKITLDKLLPDNILIGTTTDFRLVELF